MLHRQTPNYAFDKIYECILSHDNIYDCKKLCMNNKLLGEGNKVNYTASSATNVMFKSQANWECIFVQFDSSDGGNTTCTLDNEC